PTPPPTGSNASWRWALAATSPSRSRRKCSGPNWNVRWGLPVFDTTIETALAESVGEVLEKMFFVEPPEVGERPAGPSAGIAAHVIFDGDPPGCFDLHLDLAAAQTIASNFVGLDAEELSSDDLEQVIGEL